MRQFEADGHSSTPSKKVPQQPQNVWNDRHRRKKRPINRDRVWYHFAKEVLLDAGLTNGSAVDLGCGVGEFAGILDQLGCQVHGLDGERDHVQRTREAGFAATLGDLEQDLPMPTGTFNLVTCLEVIEHIARAEHMLLEIHRILLPGGYLVLSTPNFSIWQCRIRYMLGKPPVNEGVHLRFFTPSSLEACLGQCGFGIVGRRSFGPVSGVNFLREKLGREPVHWRVPRLLEPAFAEHLVYLCRRNAPPHTGGSQ